MLNSQARFLDALSALYPGGIPQRLLVAPKPKLENFAGSCEYIPTEPQALIYFVDSDWGLSQSGAPFEGENGTLLRDIVEKGMKLAGKVALVGEHVAKLELVEKLKVDKEIPVLYLALQSNLAEFDRQARGTWFEFHGRRSLLSHSLSEVRRNPQAKKELWVDLKSYMENL